MTGSLTETRLAARRAAKKKAERLPIVLQAGRELRVSLEPSFPCEETLLESAESFPVPP
jgi:hypothetical protein